jgi:DNA-binding winged helix-turn-helix (wHTH) protein
MAELYEFGVFRLVDGRVFRGAEAVKVPARGVAILLVLLDNAGKVLSSEEIFDAVWPGSNKPHARTVANTMYALRKALDDPKGLLIKSQDGYYLSVDVKKLTGSGS